MTERITWLVSTFTLMGSSELFSPDQRKKFTDIAKDVNLVKINVDFVAAAGYFHRACETQWEKRRESGGVLALNFVDEVISAWRELWLILKDLGADGLYDDEQSVFRSYLLLTASISPCDGTSVTFEPPNVPLLREKPEWDLPIDDLLNQRYERQCAWMINKVKKTIRLSSAAIDTDASQFLDILAPNVDVGGCFQLFIRTELYKIPHAVSIKTKSIYCPHKYGHRAAAVLREVLLGDADLKAHLVEILASFDGSRKFSHVYGHLVELFVKHCLMSFLKQIKSNDEPSGRFTSQQCPLPIRTDLQALSNVSKGRNKSKCVSKRK